MRAIKRRERERAPAWVSWAAPTSYWVPWWILGAVLGVIAALGTDAPVWLAVLGGPVGGLAADLYWRRTRPPRQDARWSPIARLFYKRRS